MQTACTDSGGPAKGLFGRAHPGCTAETKIQDAMLRAVLKEREEQAEKRNGPS